MPITLVTGATAGIGAAFARRLAAERHDLVLVARDGNRLADQAAGLRSRHGVQVEVIAADLVTAAGCGVVEERLAHAEVPVDMLVNNAGIGLKDSFLHNDIADEERMLALNVRAVLRLTHAALPLMLERGDGAIVNVSSVAGFGPRPGSTYPATKAWVTNFSESVALAVRGKGVRAMALCPGFTRTEFHHRAGIATTTMPDWMWLDADEVVRVGLRDLRRGRTVSVPSVRYKLATALLRHAPRVAIYRAERAARRRMGGGRNY